MNTQLTDIYNLLLVTAVIVVILFAGVFTCLAVIAESLSRMERDGFGIHLEEMPRRESRSLLAWMSSWLMKREAHDA